MNHTRSTDSQIAAPRSSACPGLLRIVPAQDGGICRIRLPCGRLTVRQAEVIAASAARYGSGAIEITNRANLQLRGIDAARGAALIEELLAAGLGPTAHGVAMPDADDVRNVLASPTAGIDAGALLDIEQLAAGTLELLQAHTGLHRLAPKFALQLDGGERAAMLEHPHDIWLSAMDGGQLAFGLAGCPPVRASDAAALAAVPAERALETIAALLHAFLEYARPEQTRMRHLLQHMAAAEFVARLQRRLPFVLRTDGAVAQWRRSPAQHAAHIGIHAQRDPQSSYVGAVPVLGRIDAAQLQALAELAAEHAATLRLTPWQSIVVADVATAAAPRVAAQLQALGFCCAADAVLAHTIACSGAAGCAKALADTKSDALRVAALVETRIAEQRRRETAAPSELALPSIHLTGCERSCAAAHRAAFTLLAKAPGRYAVYARTHDRDHASRFGRELLASADIETASAAIAAAILKTDFFATDPEPT